MRVALETARLRIRPLGAEHIDAFTAYRRDPEVARYQSWNTDYSRTDAERLVSEQPAGWPDSGSWLQLAVLDAATEVLLGDVAVQRSAEAVQPDTFELGMTFARPAQGRGFATEAVSAVVTALLTEARAHRVFAVTDARNRAAARVLERAGFRHEGRAVHAEWWKDEWTSVDSWALLASDPSALRAPQHPNT